jgi:hypothetical protein
VVAIAQLAAVVLIMVTTAIIEDVPEMRRTGNTAIGDFAAPLATTDGPARWAAMAGSSVAGPGAGRPGWVPGRSGLPWPAVAGG